MSLAPLDDLSPQDLRDAVARVDVASADLESARDSAVHASADADRLEAELAATYANGATPPEEDETAAARARARASAIARSLPMRAAKRNEAIQTALAIQRAVYSARRDARLTYAKRLEAEILEATQRLADLRTLYNRNATAANVEHRLSGAMHSSAIPTGPGPHNTFNGTTTAVWRAAGFNDDRSAYQPRAGESFESAFPALPFGDVK